MESNELLDIDLNETQEGKIVNQEGRNYLFKASKWAKFVSIYVSVILGLYCLLLVLGGIGVAFYNSTISNNSVGSVLIYSMIFGILFIAFAFYVINKLYRFANNARGYLETNKNE
jgi:uncharacterized membrane protein (DUF485 family)